MLQQGDTAPDFTAIATDGSTVRLGDFRGNSNVILFFYPEDDTPGCTREACEFRDARDSFTVANAAIFGVSTDNQAAHQAFTTKYDLNFPLLVDSDGAICRAFGVEIEGTWANRVTFLIGVDGTIKHVWDNVRVVGHAADVLATLESLA